MSAAEYERDSALAELDNCRRRLSAAELERDTATETLVELLAEWAKRKDEFVAGLAAAEARAEAAEEVLRGLVWVAHRNGLSDDPYVHRARAALAREETTS